MVTDSRDNYRRSQNEYQRPAGQFTQRDDIREYMGGGAGQNFSAMQDIQQQLPNMQANDPRVQEFKDRRRHFNRYDKNGYGEVFNKSPLEMQDMYQGMSRDVRQTNKPVYNKMYPITGGFMDYMDQGGIYGMAARGILGGLKKDVTSMGRDILDNVGIGGAVDSDEEELETFSERTFGIGSPTFPGSEMTIPYPQEGFPKPDNTVTIEDTFTEPTQPYFQDDDYLAREAELQRLVEEEQRRIDNFGTNAYSDILDDAIENQWPTIQGEMDDPFRVNEEMVFADVPENIEPLPFNDNLREAGIMAQYGQGPKYANNSMNYLNEYKKALASGEFGYDTPGGMMSYDEFVENYERLHSLPRGLHLGE
jgi:hypothetical protein